MFVRQRRVSYICDAFLNRNNYYLTMHNLKALLQQKGLKSTHQRLVIYKAALDSRHHPTAEQLYDHLKDENPSLSLGTVYKTLASLADVGLLQKVESTDGQLRFDGKTDDHHHIYCVNTREILDFEDQELNTLITDYLKQKKIDNLEISKISLHITGNKLNPEETIVIESSEH